MRFSELDASMRAFETAHDRRVPLHLYIVARIDGRNFTRLTKEVYPFEAPFDVRVRDMMVETTEHLMNCGFQILYGYTQSDEISLLFDRADGAFDRKIRKLNSILAAEASSKFSLLLGGLATFDCRISELPDDRRVVDYFRWRGEDAKRNSLEAHCYWALRRRGATPKHAADAIKRLTHDEKAEVLSRLGINLDDLPPWQRYGTGLYWESYSKEARNPNTGEAVIAVRKKLQKQFELPVREAYSDFLLSLMRAS